MKKLFAVLLVLALATSLFAGFGTTAFAEEEEEEENYETGDASLDDPRNADGIGETELLIVSFGTSFNDSRRLTIGAIEAALEAAFPAWSLLRGESLEPLAPQTHHFRCSYHTWSERCGDAGGIRLDRNDLLQPVLGLSERKDA